MNSDLNALGAGEIASGIAAGRFSAEQVMTHCLDRISSREAEVGAFVSLDRRAALEAARRADRCSEPGALNGVPFAAKDIIDTVDFPTGWGSPIYKDFTPPRNASCVELLLRAGAILIGKTVTTEFAYFQPGKTANPHNLDHTPGGSSSGSAAAVADRMVPFALGSQTAASLIRPASYCGIVGYRPSQGVFDLQGVMGLSPATDTLGLLARTVGDISLVSAVLGGGSIDREDAAAARPPRIALMRGPHWQLASGEMRENCLAAMKWLAHCGAEVGDLAHPAIFEGLSACQETVMAFEAARSHAFEYRRHRSQISDTFAALVEAGMLVPRSKYEKARGAAQTAMEALVPIMDGTDVIVSLGATGEAPKGLASTGDPVFSRAWSLLGVPCISLPFGQGRNGLPLSIMLVGRRDGDAGFLATAEWIEKRLLEARPGAMSRA